MSQARNRRDECGLGADEARPWLTMRCEDGAQWVSASELIQRPSMARGPRPIKIWASLVDLGRIMPS